MAKEVGRRSFLKAGGIMTAGTFISAGVQYHAMAEEQGEPQTGSHFKRRADRRGKGVIEDGRERRSFRLLSSREQQKWQLPSALGAPNPEKGLAIASIRDQGYTTRGLRNQNGNSDPRVSE